MPADSAAHVRCMLGKLVCMIDMPTPGDLGVPSKALSGWSSIYCIGAVEQTSLPAPQTQAFGKTCDCIPETFSDQFLLQPIIGGVDQLLH